MKKILALTLFLVTLFSAACYAEMQKTYDERNSRALVRSMKFIPAAELDPESTICINMKKLYFFDSRFYDNAIGRYTPITYFTIALIGNAAEKFENNMTYSVDKHSYIIPMTLEAKQNDKKQTVLASGTCEFKEGQVESPFVKALKEGKPVTIKVALKAKGNKALNYTIDGALLKDMGDVAGYNIYDDANFLNIAQKANQKPSR